MSKPTVTPNARPGSFAPAKGTTTPAQVVNHAPVAQPNLFDHDPTPEERAITRGDNIPALEALAAIPDKMLKVYMQGRAVMVPAYAGPGSPTMARSKLAAIKAGATLAQVVNTPAHVSGEALDDEFFGTNTPARKSKTPAHAGSKLPAPVAQTTDKPVSKKEKTMNKQTASNTPAQVVITPAQQIAALQAQLAALQAAATPAPVIEIPVLAQVDNTREAIDAAYAQIDKLQNQFTKQHARGEIEYARRTSRKIAELFGKIDALSNTPAQNKTTPTQVVISSAPVVVNKQFPGKLGITNAIKAGATPVVMRTLRATGSPVCVPLTAERNPAEFDVFVLMGAEWDTMRMTSKAYVDDTQAWDKDLPVPVAPKQLGNKPIVLVTMRRHAWDALAGKAAHVKTTPKAAKALKAAAAKKPTVKAPKLVKPLTDHAAVSLNERIDRIEELLTLLAKRK